MYALGEKKNKKTGALTAAVAVAAAAATATAIVFFVVFNHII